MTYNKPLRALLAVLVFALLFPAVVTAAPGLTSTLTLECHYKKSETEMIYMAGDVFALYRVADAVLDESGAAPVITYTARPPFPSEVEDVEALTSTQRGRKAASLADFAERSDLPADASVTIGADGRGSVGNLVPGLYLGVRTEAPAANGDYLVSPFLFGSIQIADGGAIYTLTGRPKYEPEKPDPPDPIDPTRRPDRGGNIPRDRNPYEDDPAGGTDPGLVTGQITSPTAPLSQFPPNQAPLSQTPPVLPQTGQLKWPIPLLIVLGVVVFLTGFELRYGRKQPNDEEKK